MAAQYASDLVEMTNNFASKHMDHIAVLTKQMHECQIGSELTPMITVLQHTVSLQVSQTRRPEESALSGFEEVLKSLPVREVKSFVDGIQRLMERAKSLQDLILMTERENERKRADARIEAERQANEERIRELTEENARLKAMVEEQETAAPGAATSTMQIPPVVWKKPRKSYRLSQPPSAMLKESLPKTSGAERISARGDRASHLGEDAPEDDIGSPASSEADAEHKANSEIRKRPGPSTDRGSRRSKRHMPHYDRPTRTVDLEEDSDSLLWGEADHFGSRSGLGNFTGGGMNKNEDHPPHRWSQRAAEQHHLGPSPMAGPGSLDAGIFDGELRDQTGHPSAALALDYATRPQGVSETMGNAELGVAPWVKESIKRPRLNTGIVQADGGVAVHTEQEPKPEKDVQQPAEQVKTTQESKLVENMEQMQGMVEKLSLLLQAGQHAMGAHEAGVMSTAQS